MYLQIMTNCRGCQMCVHSFSKGFQKFNRSPGVEFFIPLRESRLRTSLISRSFVKKLSTKTNTEGVTELSMYLHERDANGLDVDSDTSTLRISVKAKLSSDCVTILARCRSMHKELAKKRQKKQKRSMLQEAVVSSKALALTFRLMMGKSGLPGRIHSKRSQLCRPLTSVWPFRTSSSPDELAQKMARLLFSSIIL